MTNDAKADEAPRDRVSPIVGLSIAGAGAAFLTGEPIAMPELIDAAAPYVGFYEREFYPLSNFSAFTLTWEIAPGNFHRFDTAEAVYHWEKFNGGAPEQMAVQIDIQEAPSAHEAFKVAERNRALRRPAWDAEKTAVMVRIIRAKANQHEYVRRKLLETGDQYLVEDSWRDDFWGWGPNKDGQNMLGKIWMTVRDELRACSHGQRK